MNPPPNDPQLWLIPFIVVAFAVMFPAMWCFVCFIIASVSGYRSLAAQFRIDESVFTGMEQLPTPLYAMLGMSSYKGGTLALRADGAGLALRVSKLFPFHPPMRIPWDRVGRADATPSGFGARLMGGGVLLDGRTTLRAPGDVIAAIENARARYANAGGWSASGPTAGR